MGLWMVSISQSYFLMPIIVAGKLHTLRHAPQEGGAEQNVKSKIEAG